MRAGDDRKYPRNDSDNLSETVVSRRIKTASFFTAFLATYSVLRLAEENELELPLTAKTVKESVYVDDGLPSVETMQKAFTLFRQLQELFNRGGFKLHKWDSNSSEIRSTKTLSISGN